MRTRSLAIFAAGFAAGVLCLAVVFWLSGALSRTRVSADSQRRPLPPVVALPEINPSALAVSHPLKPPPDQAMNIGPAPEGPQGLINPVPGVDPKDIADTFTEERPGGRTHEALDIRAPRGTPVRAAAQGNVVKLFTSKEGGLTVYQFDDSQTWCFYYAHLDHYATGLAETMLLRQGDVLGYVGTTGDAPEQAPHLHFAISKLGPEKRWWQGQPIDPYPLLVHRRR